MVPVVQWWCVVDHHCAHHYARPLSLFPCVPLCLLVQPTSCGVGSLAPPSALPGTVYGHPAWLALVLPGRLLALGVELWVVWRHVQGLLREDAEGAAGPAARALTPATASDDPSTGPGPGPQRTAAG